MERGREGPAHYSWLRGTMIGGEFYSTVQRPRFEASRGIERHREARFEASRGIEKLDSRHREARFEASRGIEKLDSRHREASRGIEKLDSRHREARSHSCRGDIAAIFKSVWPALGDSLGPSRIRYFEHRQHLVPLDRRFSEFDSFHPLGITIWQDSPRGQVRSGGWK